MMSPGDHLGRWAQVVTWKIVSCLPDLVSTESRNCRRDIQQPQEMLRRHKSRTRAQVRLACGRRCNQFHGLLSEKQTQPRSLPQGCDSFFPAPYFQPLELALLLEMKLRSKVGLALHSLSSSCNKREAILLNKQSCTQLLLLLHSLEIIVAEVGRHLFYCRYYEQTYIVYLMYVIKRSVEYSKPRACAIFLCSQIT